MPSVSIVVATYNQAGFLTEAVASVRAQTFADWELLVVDDGSTDDTAAVAARFRDDDRLRYLPGAHAERAVARNRGVAAATGDLVAFLDADDLWRPEKLARQVAALAAAPGAGACYTASRFVDRDGRPLQRHAGLGDVLERLSATDAELPLWLVPRPAGAANARVGRLHIR